MILIRDVGNVSTDPVMHNGTIPRPPGVASVIGSVVKRVVVNYTNAKAFEALYNLSRKLRRVPSCRSQRVGLVSRRHTAVHHVHWRRPGVVLIAIPLHQQRYTHRAGCHTYCLQRSRIQPCSTLRSSNYVRTARGKR